MVGVTGGSGRMVRGELETALRAGAGFTLIVVNNAASGYVKALQHIMLAGRYQSSDLSEIDRPTLLDVVVTRDPAKMLPGVDARTLEVKLGDRPV